MATIPCPGQLPLFPVAKRCHRCHEMKPLSEYWRSKAAADGFQARCKPCHLTAMTESRARHLEACLERDRQKRLRAIERDPQGFKERKAAAAARDHERHRERILERGRAYYRAHSETIKANVKEWKRKNHDHVLEWSRHYRQVNRERHNAYRREYHRLNGEKRSIVLARHRALRHDNIRAQARAWTKRHPLRKLASTHARRARLKGAAGTWTEAEWLALKEQYGNRCLCCGCHESEAKLTFDHVIPPLLGGSNTIDNAQPLCQQCNSAKGKRTTDYRRCTP